MVLDFKRNNEDRTTKTCDTDPNLDKHIWGTEKITFHKSIENLIFDENNITNQQGVLCQLVRALLLTPEKFTVARDTVTY